MAEERKERPAYVRFERKAVEDRTASVLKGSAVMKDVDYAIITPVGTKDEIPRVVSEWLPHLTQQVKEMRLPPDHEQHYRHAYERWKAGEELPLAGTPIKGWQVLSPSAQANVIAANIRTVEDLAAANGEATARIGMGAVEMKQKAENWLRASKDIGTVVQLNAALSSENERLKAAVVALEAKNNELAVKLQAATGQVTGAAVKQALAA